MSLLSELKRRNVFKVAAIAFLIVDVLVLDSRAIASDRAQDIASTNEDVEIAMAVLPS